MKVEMGMVAASDMQQVERGGRQAASSEVSASQSGGEDRATLQSASASVQSLVQQTMSMPDVRQDKIAAVQQQMSSGQFQVDTQKIAGAIVAESSGQ